MKRLQWGFLAFLIPLCMAAQSEYVPNQLAGIWQYIQKDNPQQDYQHLPVWKVMQNDFTFRTFIIADPEGHCVITNKGTYELTSESVFTEHIAGSITDPNLIGKSNRISYVFEGQDTLHISYRLPGAKADGHETWVRLKLEYPE